MGEETLFRKFEKLASACKYDRPEKFGDVKGTKVNPKMWTQVIPSKPKIDLQLANMQQVVDKVAFATLQTTNFLLQNASGSTSANLIRQYVDVIALLGQINTQLAKFRRQQSKPALKQEYSTIYSAEVPLKSEYLSGDNLVKQLPHTEESIAKLATVGHALLTSTPLYMEQTFRPPGALK